MFGKTATSNPFEELSFIDGIYADGFDFRLKDPTPATLRQPEPPPAKRLLPAVVLSDLKIRTKKRGLVPLIPNPIQSNYLDSILPGWRDGEYDLRSLREIILKARQFGFSTIIEALFFIDTINNPNTNTVVIAHDAKSTATIFRMVRTFYDNLPPEKKPTARYANRNEFEWIGLGSTFLVGTAGSDGFGRGSTVHNVHASEVSKWPNPDEIVSGLFEAVPDDGNIVIESTANGLGNYYHTEYVAAENGDSVYTPRFFAWFEHPDYRREAPDPLEPATTPEEREKEARLREVHGCDDAQIRWRRWKRKALRSLQEKFEQEYPSTAREAFIVSGAKYFDSEALEELETALSGVAPLCVPAPEGFPLLAKYWHRIEVFAAPVPGRQYVVSADTAEGLDEDGVHDSDSADVLDCETWEQVAHLHGQWDTHEYGLILAELGFWFNTALLGIERNNHGHAVINAALHSGNYPEMRPGVWSGLYFHEDWDENKKMARRKPGWPTTPKTKYFALDGLATSIESKDLKIRSKKTLGELMTFLKLPRGKAGGAPGSHDDRVISLSIGDALLKMRPRQEAWSWDW